MKYLSLLVFMLFIDQATVAQSSWYGTSGAELIFSTSRGKLYGESIQGPLRFSAFFHTRSYYHNDFGKHVGIFTGWGLKNVGFIAEQDTLKSKFRSYALSVPLAIKLGNLSNDSYFFAGAALDLMFNYKQKVFQNNDRISRTSEWFSNRTNLLMPMVFLGIQMPYSTQIQLCYYPTNFLNTSYSRIENGVSVQPFANAQTQMIYVSLGFNVRNKTTKARFVPTGN